MYEAWVSIALLGIWSCLGVLLRTAKIRTKQLDEILGKLKTNGLDK